jgi:hypothetical protein
MKKFFCVICLALLAACGDGNDYPPVEELNEAVEIVNERIEEYGLNFTSMRDMEWGISIYLGDSEDAVIALLGEPTSRLRGGAGMSALSFENGMAIRFYDELAGAISARSYHENGRFEIRGYTPGMTAEQTAVHFEQHEQDSETIQYLFVNAFDENGTRLPYAEDPSVAVTHMIQWSENDVALIISQR